MLEYTVGTMPDSKEVQSAATTATACANQNLEELRKAMLAHMVKAPRSVSSKYLLARADDVEARQQGTDPLASAWQK